jgi:hypothetical protein
MELFANPWRTNSHVFNSKKMMGYNLSITLHPSPFIQPWIYQPLQGANHFRALNFDRIPSPVPFFSGADTSRSLPCCCNLQMKFVSFQSGRSPNPENKSSIWNQSCTNLKRRLNGRLLPFSAKHSKAGDTNRRHITLRATLEESSAVPASLA